MFNIKKEKLKQFPENSHGQLNLKRKIEMENRE